MLLLFSKLINYYYYYYIFWYWHYKNYTNHLLSLEKN